MKITETPIPEPQRAELAETAAARLLVDRGEVLTFRDVRTEDDFGRVRWSTVIRWVRRVGP